MKRFLPLLLSLAVPAQAEAQNLAVNPVVNEQGFAAAEDHAVSTVTASGSFGASNMAIQAGSPGGALTANQSYPLEACVTASQGRIHGLTKGDTSAFTATMTPAGTDTIAGAAGLTLRYQWQATGLYQCNGAGTWLPWGASSNPQYATTATSGGNGSFSVTFARPFASTTPVVRASPLAGASSPQIADCMIDTITNPTTSPVIAGHCSATSAVAGGSAVANGVVVMVSGADRTQ